MPLFGEFAALFTAFLWSGTSIAFSEASVRVGPFYVNVTRMFLALLWLSITLLVMQVEVNLSQYQILNLIISGFCGLVIGDTFLFKAYRSIGARISMLIMALVPPISAFTAFIFLGEKISLTAILGILITVSGIGLVIFKREEKPSSKYKIDNAGLFYAFIGAAGQAIGLIFAKNAFNEGEISGFVASFVRILSAVIIIYPVALLSKKYSRPINTFKQNKSALLFTTIGSVIGPYLGITFSMIAISHAKVGIASTLMATTPIMMLPMVRYYYKEKLSWISISGAFIAVVGIAILFLF